MARRQLPESSEQIALEEKDFNALQRRLEEAYRAVAGDEPPADLDVKEWADNPPTLAQALNSAGMGTPWLVRMFWFLIVQYREAKWNPQRKCYEYFVNGELVRRCLEFLGKIHVAARPTVNLNVNMEIKQLLVDPNLSPADTLRQIQQKMLEQAALLGQTAKREGEKKLFPRSFLKQYAENLKVDESQALLLVEQQGWELIDG